MNNNRNRYSTLVIANKYVIGISNETLMTEMIKNWIVITQRIKNRQDGLVKYAKYLTDENHPNHSKHNTGIIPVVGNYERFCQYATSQAVSFDLNNKKGGRKVESYAQSFDFVLPDTVKKPTPEQWKEIAKDLVINAHKQMGLEISMRDFGRTVFANIHDQHNPHLNLLIPRIIEGQRMDKLDKKGLLASLKKQFNASALKHCEINFNNYTPIKPNRGKRQRQWQLDQQNARAEQEKAIALREEASQMALEASQTRFEAARQVEVAVAAQTAAETAKNEAARSIQQVAEMKSLYTRFKSGIMDWIGSILKKDVILEQIAEQEVVSSVEEMQKLPNYTDSDEELILLAVQAAEIEVEPHTKERPKPVLANKIPRKRRSKPGF